ncbi:MAG TPA: zf-HC2 domain-containing protein [Verrucomicrobiae bacterium]|nr:zf-HC2 domain-containing protein [Verrucomicrobiae bacterium]
MNKNERHLTDSEALLQVDGELASRRGDEVREHLAGCAACRAKVEEVKALMAAFAGAYRSSLDGLVPSSDASRSRLRAHMAAASGERGGWWRREVAGALPAPAWAYLVAAIALGAVLLGLRYQAQRPSEAREGGSEYISGPLVPDTRLTPGAVGAVTVGQVCAMAEVVASEAPASVRQVVFHEYGLDGAPTQEYEVDHLITPGLGGTDDIRNLWPEPHGNTTWNSYVKDELEDHLHDLVCQGKLDLGTAQHDMATNWISAYKKYFHTDQPLVHNISVVTIRRGSPNG